MGRQAIIHHLEIIVYEYDISSSEKFHGELYLTLKMACHLQLFKSRNAIECLIHKECIGSGKYNLS